MNKLNQKTVSVEDQGNKISHLKNKISNLITQKVTLLKFIGAISLITLFGSCDGNKSVKDRVDDIIDDKQEQVEKLEEKKDKAKEKLKDISDELKEAQKELEEAEDLKK